MNLGEVLRHLPPLNYDLKLVSRLFYRRTAAVLRDVYYWQTRPDAPPQIMRHANSYVIYHIMKMRTANSYPSPWYCSFHITTYSPVTFAEAFSTLWLNLPTNVWDGGVPDVPPAELSEKGVKKNAIREARSLASALIRNGRPVEEFEYIITAVKPYIEETVGYIEVGWLGRDVVERLIKSRDIDLYRWSQSLYNPLILLYSEGNDEDELAEYYAWLLSVGHPYDSVAYRVSGKLFLSQLKKGSSLDLPFVESAIMEVPVSCKIRNLTLRIELLRNYLANETDYDAGAARLARWEYTGPLAYTVIEDVVYAGNLSFAKKLLDDLPDTKPKEYTPTQVKHVRGMLYRLNKLPELTGYPSLDRLLVVWQRRGGTKKYRGTCYPY